MCISVDNPDIKLSLSVSPSLISDKGLQNLFLHHWPWVWTIRFGFKMRPFKSIMIASRCCKMQQHIVSCNNKYIFVITHTHTLLNFCWYSYLNQDYSYTNISDLVLTHDICDKYRDKIVQKPPRNPHRAQLFLVTKGCDAKSH